ncbi:TetR/AcrR family transcriptional regulator [Flagellimonas meridianipacifica]|uniref:TetR/AcrR family transcriptional repressor of nem operon n=1 Tax=Flagellimonas meridianipacifica TaxID=1080225 RepID=A0A2T0MIA0_9FLAO|nr:TetR/AcrR family transcriptional regulator [Allomuricauda pacifica]PRX57275.1 TetR/AcrR family transcriptional repressor of nem operon [Allomuricauda pacifica]
MPRTKQFDENKVLNKAMELFWEKGFHATSMQDLVSHLGINRASLYDTFGGKEELFNRAFQEYRNSSGDAVKGILAAEPSVKKGFHKLFDFAIEEAVGDTSRKGCFVVNTATELIPNDGAMHSILQNHMNSVEELFATHVQKGIDRGEIDASKNAKDLGLMLFTFYNGFRVVSKIDSDPKKLQRMVAAALSVLD